MKNIFDLIDELAHTDYSEYARDAALIIAMIMIGLAVGYVYLLLLGVPLLDFLAAGGGG
jgi:hypothetical protein